ncbi:MAG: phospholipase D-like domain-containing protein [Pirellulales bacterium]
MNQALASDIATFEWLTSFNHWGSIGFVFGLLIQIVVVFRVIMGKRGVGETLAWVMLVLGIPVVGWIMYLLIGELRLGASREKRYQKLSSAVQRRLKELEPIESQVPWPEIDQEYAQIAKTGRGTLSFPILPGNQLELIEDWQLVFDRIIADIDSATTNCDLQFYIWHSGGRTQDVVAAIERARSRGVHCRILVDSLGSWKFLHSEEAKRLEAAGAEVREALPSRLWRLPFVRYDLRMHRKLVLIDDQIAWTGSLNLIDPRFFKQEAGVGQWIDAMVRVRGPIVEGLAIVFQTDWQTEDEQGT